jgi:uncharacterized protein YcfL
MKIRTFSPSYLLTLLTLVSLAGCHAVNSVDVSADGSYNWIKGDSVLKNEARVRTANKEMVNGLLHVQVVVHNKYKSDGNFKYRFVWYNANGMEVHTPLTTWEYRNIIGKQTITLDGIAPDSSVTDCRLEMFRVDQ